MIFAAAVLAAASVVLFFVARASARQGDDERTVPEDTWDTARAAMDGQVGRILLTMARPLEPVAHLQHTSALYRHLDRKLAGTGGTLYGGSVDVFMSVQIAAMLLGAVIVGAAVPLAGSDGTWVLLAALTAVAVAGVPYSQVNDAAKKRQAQVRTELPQFAELMLMPVSSGYGIIPALDFTATRMDGIVADEVRTMVALLSSRAGTEEDIFHQTGARLGDPAAATFFTTLLQAYTDGTRVGDALRSQAEQLRHQEHQARRAAIKKLPNKLVMLIAMHLLPFLFIVMLLPAVAAMGAL